MRGPYTRVAPHRFGGMPKPRRAIGPRGRHRCAYIRVARPGRTRIIRLSINGSTSTTVLRMSPDLLRRIGVALYGEHWHSDLARDLVVPRRTVQRWEAGDAPVPLT